MLSLDAMPCCLNLIIVFFLLEMIKGQYALDDNFKDVILNCKEGRTWNKFVLNDGYLFRAKHLCIPVGSVRLLLL